MPAQSQDAPVDMWDMTSSQLVAYGQDHSKEVARHIKELAHNFSVTLPEALATKPGVSTTVVGAFINDTRTSPFQLLSEMANNDYLFSYLLDSMAIPSILALGFTSRPNYVLTMENASSRLRRRLVRFNLNANAVLTALEESHAIIYGSFALVCVIPFHDGFTIDNIDFVVDNDHLMTLIRALHLPNKYEDAPPHHHPLLPRTRIRRVKSKVYTTDGGKRLFLNFHILDSWDGASVFEPLLYSATTLTMNAITGKGYFMPYGRLVDHGVGLENSINNIYVHPERPHLTSNDRRRVEVHTNVKVALYSDKGLGRNFIIPRGLDSTHAIHSQWGPCGKEPSCPLTVRSLEDKGCFFMPLFQDDRRVNINLRHKAGHIKCFPLDQPNWPDTMWRLAGPSSSLDNKKGFVFTPAD